MSTAQLQGTLWGARARDYADFSEPAFRPLFAAVLDAAGVSAGTWLLDVGCGTGLAARMAADRGALIAGLDAAEPSLAVARERAPNGDFRVGDMEELPWPDRVFDVVTGFNAFQFAGDVVNALRQAGRVVLPGGRVAMAVWGRAEECDMAAVAPAFLRFLPPPPPGAESPFAFGVPGRVEALLEQAGLVPSVAGEAVCVFDLPDRETALRALLSAGPAVAAVQRAGEDAVRQALDEALWPFQTGSGGYRLSNTCRYIIAQS